MRDATERLQVRESLEASVRSNDDLIASISHELCIPLAAVVGFAEILKSGTAGLSEEDRAEMVSLIAKEGFDLANIVDDLLVTAGADTDTLSVVKTPVNLRYEAAQVLGTWNMEAIQHIDFAAAPIWAIGDPGRVRQIVRNLISNALKYGGERVHIETSRDDSTVRLQVYDDGPGVPEVHRERIFEPYTRVHETPGLTASFGLGLTISRHLAQLMDGDLTYRCQAGESIFELALPPADSPSIPQ